MRQLLLFTSLFLLSFVGSAQDNSLLYNGEQINGELIRVRNSKTTVVELDEVPYEADKIYTRLVAPSTSTNTSSENAGRTAAEFSVAPSGAASYTIPFTLPQGIRDIGPAVGLVYNSQAGEGIPGWGWNITGLSTITRIGTTKFHDGYVDGVDLDGNDRYVLDGQRLMLKSGIYGAANSVYETENYSNIKITALGNVSGAPSYFKVQYPDGALAYYGLAGNSRGKLEWAVHKKVDPQGNFIQYDYAISNNLLRINSIKYGSKGSTISPNEVRFIYKNRVRPQLSYIASQTFKRDEILDRVEIYSGGQIFRKYTLQHSTTSLGYERISNIQETNRNNNSFPPIYFTYGTSSTSITRINEEYSSIFPGVDSREDDIRMGDFDADGHQDMIVFRRGSNKTNFHLFNSVFGDSGNQELGQTINLGFDELFFSSILNHQNKNLQNQAITLVSEAVEATNSTVRFKNYLYGSGLFFQYEKAYTFPIGPEGNYNCDYGSPPGPNDRKIKKQYISGDFNGDGLTDVFAIPIKHYVTNCNGVEDPYSQYEECICEQDSVNLGNSPVYFINLDRSITGDTAVNVGTLISRINPSEDQLLGTDFNGDGKTDLIHIRNGSIRVYSLNNDGTSINQIAYTSDSYIDLEKPLISGDFNGDGKFDFATVTNENSEDWRFFLSKGTTFHKYTKDINIPYKKSELVIGTYNVNGISMSNPLYEYKYLSQDFNGDGKTDILYHEVVSPWNSTDIVSERMKLYSNSYDSASLTPYFQLTGSISDTNNGMAKFGIPIFTEGHGGNGNLEYGYIIQNRVFGYKFNKDHKVDTELTRITNDGLTTDIEYKNLTADNVNGDAPSFYTSDVQKEYPFVDIQVAPSLRLVERAIRTGSGMTQQQDFYYENAVINTAGLGFMGYEYTKRSNWYGDGVPILISGSRQDMSKRGAVVEEWVSSSLSNSPSQFSSKKEYNYVTSLSSNKVFANFPSSISTINGLEGYHTIVDTYTYNSYNNITQLLRTYPIIGYTRSTYTYSNNSSHSDYLYHVGRSLSKKVENQLYGQYFSNEEEYTYSNNILKIIKRKGVNTPWLTETLSHDLYGNITIKTVSGSGVTPREERFFYDNSGRFLIKSRDSKGLETTYNFDITRGTVISTIDPYDNSETFTYDGWDRPLIKVDYLGNETKYFYNKEILSGNNTTYTTYIDYPNKPDYKNWTNVFGLEIKTQSKSFNNKWIVQDTEFDVSGRIKRESVPYFENESAALWTNVLYDQYGRLISKTDPNNRTINSYYDGLTITTDDGVRNITSTKDVLGNVVLRTDDGGTVRYQYFPNGVLREAHYEDNIITTTIDGWGRKASLTDPSAGSYTYEYNIYGEIINETNPKGSVNYTYDNNGLLTNKEIVGDYASFSLDYLYDNLTKNLVSINGIDNLNNKSYIYNYLYDNFSRLSETTEITDGAQYTSVKQYDNLGRTSSLSFSTNEFNTGLSNNVSVTKIYDNSGILVELRESTTNELLWKLVEKNALALETKVDLGNGLRKTKEYDQYGNTTKILDVTPLVQGATPAMHMEYEWNSFRGLLISRENKVFDNWEETFTHDNLDRLTEIIGPAAREHEYDDRGRIADNTLVGKYQYGQSNNPYGLTQVNLNNQGDLFYQQRIQQIITYNSFKKPVSIKEQGQGKINYEYSPLMERSVAYYGGNSNDILERRYIRRYSAIAPIEIVIDQETGSTKILTYIAGDQYNAPIVHITKQESAEITNEFNYLHRDYLGSILGISGENGELLEQAQYGAWGTVDKFLSINGNSNFDNESILGRGFTGHEHLFEAGLIQMNGRLYDSSLGRFLNPDNFIQDPYNTQSFNRYSYVWNNPLLLSDPSGEIIFTAALLIGIGVGALAGAYFGGVQANDGNFNPLKWNWSSGKTLIGVFGGAVIGGIAGGVGVAVGFAVAPILASAGITGGILGGGLSAAAGGFVSGAITGGLMSLLPGGNPDNFLRNTIIGAVSGAALGFVIGGTIGGILTPKGHSIWTGKSLSNPKVSTVSSLQPEDATPLSTVDDGANSTNPASSPKTPNTNTIEPVKINKPQATYEVVKGIDGRDTFQLADELVAVRHHTGRDALKIIDKSKLINPSRGAPYGVDVEVAPFLNPKNVEVGQFARGAYVEFLVPRSQLSNIPGGYLGGTGNAARIITNGAPLDLSSSPFKVHFKIWKWF
ncbi:RHS repeat-associated core domain-containing protein [Dokdonia ponticola]|uniref:RHS repeat-associated core domain-containing protein n=1 Tax=Dokdonia ponticola TaxID=2041041 RepID=A0ABV9HVB2_9FLAO